MEADVPSDLQVACWRPGELMASYCQAVSEGPRPNIASVVVVQRVKEE